MKSKMMVIVPLIIILIAAPEIKYIYDTNQKSEAVAVMKDSKQTEATVKETAAKETVPTVEDKKEEPLTIVAVGDILLGRGVGMRLENQKKGYIYPFERVVGFLKEGDVVFANLEEPITASTHSLTGIGQGGKYVLKNEPQAFEGIKFAGFNLLHLANNHILDYYDKGLYDTIELLEKNGIAYAGAGKNLDEARKPAIIEKKGVKIGMLAYTDMSEVLYKGNPPLRFIAEKERYGVAPRNHSYIKEDVDKLRQCVDLVIVSLHWGLEESFEVLEEQRELAHRLMDQGVDIILGHHPHQFQGIEIYNGKPIIYSMGNFIFDQNDPENQESFILNMKYSGRKLTEFKAIPVRTADKTQVIPLAGIDAELLLKRQLELCRRLDTKCHIAGDRLVFDLK
ncbi:MAG: CapA family protein [Clostridia bacterium]|nr:CapA family protein [Clostridia bacterium]